ncbi:MAG: prepilin-type N-terminal cleavage/methylation domain-containing protein [Nitrospiraceae bacterium]|nr:prepilin-type N-terminal cleavage/methylation domain-containing protein [Nitrospiraceae bacterium]
MKTGNRKGFTLLEILLALTLTVLLMAIVFASLRLAHRSDEKGRAVRDIDQRMRITADRIAWLIRGAYPYYFQKDGKRYPEFEGAPDSVTLVTTSTDSYAKGPEDIAGLKWVKIYVEDGELKIAERVFFMGEDDDAKENTYVLDPQAASLKLEYLDVDEKGDNASWVSGWDPEEKEGMPGAVRGVITLKDGNGREYEVKFTAPMRAAALRRETKDLTSPVP